ncbi:MAG: hypothetical protein FJ098_12190, partial [Deltaproteobacteria bacterium]|nr:hypothetical protein [Deltaproteobacteria bacterium]
HSDCCDIPEGSWHAEFREPLPTPDTGLPDAVTGDRTPSPDVPVPPDASEGQIRALEHLNALRAGLGLGAVAGSEALNEACQAHAQYYLYHCENYEETGLSPHSENPDWPEGFTGVNFANRVLHFGYGGTPGWEVMAFVGDPMAAIDSWMETLYHRIPFVDPGTADAGYGGLTSGCQWWATGVDVMDFGRGPDTSGEPVPYPAPGQTGVPASWDGMESPQPPLPAGSAYPSGPVITLSFPAGAFQIDSHRLLGPGPVEVAHQYLDPGSDPHGYLERTVALYALSPLQEGTTYTVELKGLWKGADATWQWQFTTGP